MAFLVVFIIFVPHPNLDICKKLPRKELTAGVTKLYSIFTGRQILNLCWVHLNCLILDHKWWFVYHRLTAVFCNLYPKYFVCMWNKPFYLLPVCI